MNVPGLFRISIILLLPLSIHCTTPKNHTPMNAGFPGYASDSLINRHPAVAGSFYPSDPKELRSMLSEMFSAGTSCLGFKHILALIVPHAGYVFSGTVAASGFNQLDPSVRYDNVFIIGSSHHVSFNGASIYTMGNFDMPLGTVKVNRELGKKLIHDAPGVFTSDPDAQLPEHSLEVQIPFLQQIYKDQLTIVPIVLGTQSTSTCKKIAEALQPYFCENNLFVISTDFSHYPSYKDALVVDKATADALCTNSPENFLRTLQNNEDRDIPNLATSICGWTSALSLLNITHTMKGIHYHVVKYMNSGDTPRYGDKDRVVGYNAIVVTSDEPVPGVKKESSETQAFTLSEKDRRNLVTLARRTVDEYVKTGHVPSVDPNRYSESLRTPCGAFVTLRKSGQLRGCIGQFNSTDPLWKVVQEVAVSAATRDYRFDPVTSPELKDIDIEISVLTPLKRIHSASEIELGKDGIYMKKGMSSGTFLPQVATETGWDLEEFLGHCARDKAGMGWDGWKDAELYTYRALIIEEKDYR